MKITFYTEESYGSLQIGEYEFIPIHNMDETEEITLKIKDIIKELPTMFKKYAKILKSDENFQKYIKRRPEMEKKYSSSGHYKFNYKNVSIARHSGFVIHNSEKHTLKLKIGHYYVSVNSSIKIVVSPQTCMLCKKKKSFINTIEESYGTVVECLYCNDIREKQAEEYKEKKRLATHYSPWNEFLCDACESYGYECDDCRNFYKGMCYDTYDDMY